MPQQLRANRARLPRRSMPTVFMSESKLRHEKLKRSRMESATRAYPNRRYAVTGACRRLCAALPIVVARHKPRVERVGDWLFRRNRAVGRLTKPGAGEARSTLCSNRKGGPGAWDGHEISTSGFKNVREVAYGRSRSSMVVRRRVVRPGRTDQASLPRIRHVHRGAYPPWRVTRLFSSWSRPKASRPREP